MQTNFNKLYGSSPLIGLNYMMHELKHDLLESSKQLPSVKLSKTYEAFFVSNQTIISAVASNFYH